MSMTRSLPPRTASFRPAARGRVGAHAFLGVYSAIAIVPILIIAMNSMKSTAAIFESPFAPPGPGTFSLEGYQTVFGGSDFLLYFWNSTVITVVSVAVVVALASAAGFALATYKTKATPILVFVFAAGLMLPIRLGTVSILEMMISWRLINSHLALILVYVAMSLPLAVTIMTQFMSQAPQENKEAARIDGAGELRVMFMTLPLVRPGIAAVAAVSMLPIWNDLWFPLILAPGEATRTVTLGVQQFVGQFTTDWSAVLAALTMSAVPLIILFVIFARQFIGGLTAGSSK